MVFRGLFQAPFFCLKFTFLIYCFNPFALCFTHSVSIDHQPSAILIQIKYLYFKDKKRPESVCRFGPSEVMSSGSLLLSPLYLVLFRIHQKILLQTLLEHLLLDLPQR